MYYDRKYRYWDWVEVQRIKQESAAIREKLCVIFHQKNLGERISAQTVGWHDCAKCGEKYYLSQGEVEFFKSKRLHIPKHCVKCRETRYIEYITHNVRTTSRSGYTPGVAIGSAECSQQNAEIKKSKIYVDSIPQSDVENEQLRQWLYEIAITVYEHLSKMEPDASAEKKCVIYRTMAVYWQMLYTDDYQQASAIDQFIDFKNSNNIQFVSAYKFPEVFEAINLSELCC